jgi:hypothetical protein
LEGGNGSPYKLLGFVKYLQRFWRADNVHQLLSYAALMSIRKFRSIASSIVQSMTKAAVAAAGRLLWKMEKAYSLGIPKKKLAPGESQTEEEHAYARRYTMFWRNGRSFWT